MTYLFVTSAYNAEKWIERCLSSVAHQSRDFRCIVYDDCSTDDTYARAREQIGSDSRFILRRSPKRRGMLHNIDAAITEYVAGPDEVVVILDGDDWLKHDQVLDTLDRYYADSATWLTYGSYERWDGSWLNRLGLNLKRGHARAYPDYIADNNFYRYYVFRASHLRTFRAFLWQRIDPADLRDDAGNYFQSASDVAEMIPMLEMAGPAHAVYVPEILVIYNNENPLGIRNSGRKLSQKIAEMTVRSRARYSRLDPE